MKFGINTLLWTAAFNSTHLPLLAKFKEAGFDGVEIAGFDWADFPAKEVRRTLEELDLQVAVCTAMNGDRSLISEDGGRRQRARDLLLASIRITAEIGGDTLVGPFCSPVGYLPGRRRTDDEWKRAVEELQALTPALDEYGVTLANEPLNRFETYFLNTTADGVRLCAEVAHHRVGLLFDTFHANIEEKDVGEALKAAGQYVYHVHTCENDRGTPGSGHVDWPGVFEALRAIGYDRWAVIESFGSHIPEIAAAACIWRDLAPNSADIAFDGLTFLKQARLG